MLPWERYVTCCNCGHPFDDNQRMKDGSITSTTAGWAKNNLLTLAEIAEDHRLPQWYVDEVRRIAGGIRVMPPEGCEAVPAVGRRTRS